MTAPSKTISGLLALGLLFTSSLIAGEGVPIPPIDYDKPVDQWWATHPMNPAAEEHVGEIESPEPVISLADHAGDLQKAIDSLPEAGGTIRIPAGTWKGGFQIVGRKHIHLIGEEGAIIQGSENYVLGDELNHHYHEFNVAVMQAKPEGIRIVTELPAQDIYFKNLTFDTSPVRLGSCKGILFEDCLFRQPENRNEGNVDADGKKVLRWWRPLPVTGIMGLQNIWLRGCEFAGHNANAIYLDGVQGSGIVNCKFAGVDKLWSNAVILFTNDDVSLDTDGDGKLAPFERRDVRQFVVDGCEFGKGYKRGAVAASGRDILAQNCVVNGPLQSFLVINAKTSGKEIYYESFGVKAINNTLNDVRYIITAEGAKDRPEKGLPDWWVWTKYEIGRFEIRDNQITGMIEPLLEIPNDSEILGPHKIANNGPAQGAE